MFINGFWDFIGSQLFGNLILVATAVIALSVGLRQVALNDVVELYASPETKTVIDPAAAGTTQATQTVVPIIAVQNPGSRLIYLDKYIFNGSVYATNGQVLPPSLNSPNAIYWIDLPTNGVIHVSVDMYYHDLDGRKWKSTITADLQNGIWHVATSPRTAQ